MEISVINQAGEEKKKLPLNSAQWSTPLSRYNVSLVNRYYLSNQRQGTKKVKSRGEIKGSTRKIYRQKGTGGARHGHRYAPQFVGGGVAFGPTGEENYSLDINKKLKKKFLQSLLGEKIRQQNLIVIDQIKLDNYKVKVADKLLTDLLYKDLESQIEKLKLETKKLKTAPKRTPEQEKELTKKEKELTKLKKKMKQKAKTLIVLAYQEEKKVELTRSLRNLPYVSLTDSKIINSRQLLGPRHILFTQSAWVETEKRLS